MGMQEGSCEMKRKSREECFVVFWFKGVCTWTRKSSSDKRAVKPGKPRTDGEAQKLSKERAAA